MDISQEMRLLANSWSKGDGWPKRLDGIEIHNIRGWTGQRIDFSFPIVAIVGENGAGKSTVLQAAASIYRSKANTKFASSFFPDTPWEKVTSASIKYWVREGVSSREGSIRKETTRWRGNPERRERVVQNIDLSRIQPVFARVGFSRLAKPQHKLGASKLFEAEKLKRLSQIMGKAYNVASMSKTQFDESRAVPVISSKTDVTYSGFHSGAGETTMVELLTTDIPKHSLILIDEIETSLHPRSQRRLMRDLATVCRQQQAQIIVSTHSPYILDELPEEARLYIWEGAQGREVIKGVSPQFAMTKMDLEKHPEMDIFVEDDTAKTAVQELIVAHDHNLMHRCLIVPYGAASVGKSLGQMADKSRFPRPTVVFLDGDQGASIGCSLIPGGDAPERVVFGRLQEMKWQGLAARLDRSFSQIADACEHAKTAKNHHEWIRLAADDLTLSGTILWQAMCAIWAKDLSLTEAETVLNPIRLGLDTKK